MGRTLVSTFVDNISDTLLHQKEFEPENLPLCRLGPRPSWVAYVWQFPYFLWSLLLLVRTGWNLSKSSKDLLLSWGCGSSVLMTTPSTKITMESDGLDVSTSLRMNHVLFGNGCLHHGSSVCRS